MPFYTKSEDGKRFSSRVDFFDAEFYIEVYQNQCDNWIYEVSTDCDTCIKTNNTGEGSGETTKEACFELVKEVFTNEAKLFIQINFGEVLK